MLGGKTMRIPVAASLFALFLSAAAPAQTFVADPAAGLPSGWAMAWADYDRDGDLDVAGGFPGGTLFRNLGDGTFLDVTIEEGLENGGRAHAWADYDGDGWLDLFVVLGGANRLYRNLRCGGFVEVAPEAGLTGPIGSDFNAAWADYDGDGRPDLFLAFGTGLLYRNLGDGTFVDVTVDAGLVGQPGDYGLFTGVWGDYDDDRRPDLFITHVTGRPCRLYHNRGDGAFDEVTFAAGVQRAFNPYGVGWGDYTGDGRLDLFASMQVRGANVLYANRGDGTFEFTGNTSGVRLPGRSGWGGAVWGDYDNDGWLDLLSADLRTGDLLFRNRGDGTFEERGALEGFAQRSSTSAVLADADGDGDLDAFTSGSGFLRNVGGAGKSVSVRLLGNRSGKDGLGARVIASVGGRTIVREVSSGSAYAGQDGVPGTVHLGIGPAMKIDRLEVLWPAGATTVDWAVPSGTTATFVEPPPGNTLEGERRRVDLTAEVAVVFEVVAAEGTTVLGLDPDGPPAPPGWEVLSAFRLDTTADVRGETWIEAAARDADVALLGWDAGGHAYPLEIAPVCPFPGRVAGVATGFVRFALARRPLPIDVRIEPETIERRSTRKDSIVTAFVTVPEGVEPDPAAWRLAGAPAFRIHGGGRKLLLQFYRREMALPSVDGPHRFWVVGRTRDGRNLAGSDVVRVQ